MSQFETSRAQTSNAEALVTTPPDLGSRGWEGHGVEARAKKQQE
jgi:hypothetical protein